MRLRVALDFARQHPRCSMIVTDADFRTLWHELNALQQLPALDPYAADRCAELRFYGQSVRRHPAASPLPVG